MIRPMDWSDLRVDPAQLEQIAALGVRAMDDAHPESIGATPRASLSGRDPETRALWWDCAVEHMPDGAMLDGNGPGAG